MTPPSPGAAPKWTVRTLGEATVPSPLALSVTAHDGVPDYVPEGTRVLRDSELLPGQLPDVTQSFEKAGPRERIYFEPRKTRAAILTAGGLCPGINNVIRSLVLHLSHKYGVEAVFGIRYGFAGLDPAIKADLVRLSPADVAQVHLHGGTILGTSRGKRELDVMLKTLADQRIDCLFVIGGDGTMRGAHELAQEALRRGMKLAVVGIPKTIDNDVPYVDKTFGFETAVSMARIAIDAANTEATSALNGIGLVKLMGRDAGFIAAHAALASHDVNVCLVPEVRFDMDGPHGVLAYLQHRIETRGHAVIVVAEGCGMRLAQSEDAPENGGPRDASGNLRFGSVELDIGLHLKATIEQHFGKADVPVTLKYIDPSYMLRGVPANATDAIFCDELARHAAHAAMAGKTDVMVGRWHRSFTHVPLPLALSEKRRIDPDKELWLAVMETTGQPRFVAV